MIPDCNNHIQISSDWQIRCASLPAGYAWRNAYGVFFTDLNLKSLFKIIISGSNPDTASIFPL
jgi:hypothetical protein